MSYDVAKNFAYSTILMGGVIGSTTGTTLKVQSGQGALFGAPMNITVWPAGVSPLSTNAEIMRVTNITLDTLTVVRAQEGSTVQGNITAGYQVADTITALDITQIENDYFNAYKFSAYRSTAYTDGNGSLVQMVFNIELFDTGSNYSTSTGNFVAPVAGFYQFNAGFSTSVTALNVAFCSLFQNGSEVLRGGQSDVAGTAGFGRTVSGLLQLSLGDTVGAYSQGSGGAGNAGQQFTYFNGFLVSQT